MSRNPRTCPDCDRVARDQIDSSWNRRDFLKASGAAAIATASIPSIARAAAPSTKPPETVVQHLFEALTDKQRSTVCFDWDHIDSERGLLRSRVGANWSITDPPINSEFFTDEQRALVREIFEGMVQPEWHAKFDKQFDDDMGGFGEDHHIAIFGHPGQGDFEFVLTGRHTTMRCDGNSADHVAFGGPIFYGHDTSGDRDAPQNHPGNVFWHQAIEANRVFEMLDGRQRKLALIAERPEESAVHFAGRDGTLPGIPISEFSSDQHEQVQKVLTSLLEPYRQSDQDEALACLKAQGGLEACSLAFYKDGDIGGDQVWDCWRLEGPSFAWYFRGEPHVHVWVNIADSPTVALNSG